MSSPRVYWRGRIHPLRRIGFSLVLLAQFRTFSPPVATFRSIHGKRLERVCVVYWYSIQEPLHRLHDKNLEHFLGLLDRVTGSPVRV